MNKKKLIITIFVCMLFLLIMFLIALVLRSNNEKKYKLANFYFSNGQYIEAQDLYYSLGKYKDAEILLDEVTVCIQKSEIYDEALREYKAQNYELALEKLNTIIDFKDSKEQIILITYDLAMKYYENNQLIEARKYFSQIEDFDDSADYLHTIDIRLADNIARTAYNDAMEYYDQELYQEAMNLFNDLGEYEDSKVKIELCKENIKRLELSKVITGGMYNSFGVANDGTVLQAGRNQFNQCNVELWKNIISIDNYAEFTIGLKKDGTVNVSGNFSEKQQTNISKWEHVIDIAAGDLYVVALKYDGKVVAEGHNGNGQCNVDDWEDIIDIDAGWSFTVGLTSTGELKFAGVSDSLEKQYLMNKDDWKDVIKISASGGDPKEYHTDRGKGHVVGLKTDGTIVAIGDNSQGQCDIFSGEWNTKFVAVAAGDWYTVGLTVDGEILITGKNKSGRYYIKQDKIAKWREDKNVKDIAAGYGQTLILKKDGSVDGIWFADNKIISNNVYDWEKPIILR